MLTYIGIEHVIGRLNQVFGEGYSTEITNTQIQGDWAIVSVRLTYTDANGVTRWKDGIGADLWTYVDNYGKTQIDMDKAIKTAYAEGIKKAGHQLGVGLYLWDDDIREAVEAEMKGQSAPHHQRPPQSNPPSNAGDPNSGPRLANPKQIGKVSAEMGRVGWSEQQGRDYLVKTFNKLSRAELSSAEISQMIDHLVALPSKENA